MVNTESTRCGTASGVPNPSRAVAGFGSRLARNAAGAMCERSRNSTRATTDEFIPCASA